MPSARSYIAFSVGATTFLAYAGVGYLLWKTRHFFYFTIFIYGGFLAILLLRWYGLYRARMVQGIAVEGPTERDMRQLLLALGGILVCILIYAVTARLAAVGGL